MQDKFNFISNKQKGSLMVEIIVATSIVTVVIIAASLVTQKSIYLARQSVHQSQSAMLLEEGAEATRILRDNGWSNISSLNLDTNYYLTFTGGTWILSSTPNVVDIFTRKVVFSSAYRDGSQNLAASGVVDNQTKLVTITVSWVEGGQTISKNLQFYITDLFS